LIGFAALTDMLWNYSSVTETRICLNECCLDLANILFSILTAGELIIVQFSERQQRLPIEGQCMLLNLKAKLYYYLIYCSFKCYGYIKRMTSMLTQDGRKLFCVTPRATLDLCSKY